MVNVKIYTIQYCPFCNALKDFLRKYGIDYEEFDIENNKNAAIEMVKKSGQIGVPVIDINGIIVVGFDYIQLKEILGII